MGVFNVRHQLNLPTETTINMRHTPSLLGGTAESLCFMEEVQ